MVVSLLAHPGGGDCLSVPQWWGKSCHMRGCLGALLQEACGVALELPFEDHVVSLWLSLSPPVPSPWLATVNTGA